MTPAELNTKVQAATLLSQALFAIRQSDGLFGYRLELEPCDELPLATVIWRLENDYDNVEKEFNATGNTELQAVKQAVSDLSAWADAQAYEAEIAETERECCAIHRADVARGARR